MASGALTPNPLQPPGVFDGMQRDNPDAANDSPENSTSCAKFLGKRLTEAATLSGVADLVIYCALPLPGDIKFCLVGIGLGAVFCCGLARSAMSPYKGEYSERDLLGE